MNKLDTIINEKGTNKNLSASIEKAKQDKALFDNSLVDLETRFDELEKIYQSNKDKKYLGFRQFAKSIRDAKRVSKDLHLKILKAKNYIDEGNKTQEEKIGEVFKCKMLLTYMNQLITVIHFGYVNTAIKIPELVPYLYATML